MPDIGRFLNKSLGVYNIHGVSIEPNYWQAGVIILLLFLLVFTLARVRFLYIHWSLGKGSLSFLFYGFLLALIVEGFLVLNGRTLLTQVLGWQNAPKPIGTALDVGRQKLVDVLGSQSEIPDSNAQMLNSYEKVLSDYKSLQSGEKDKVKTDICTP